MLYKKNYRQAISRMKDLYSGKGTGRIYAKMNIPNPVLEKYARDFADGPVEQPDFKERARFWDDVMSIYSGLEDDSIPNCYLSELDQGLYAGLLGADISYIRHAGSGWISSMTKPFMSDISAVKKLSFHENSKVYRDYLKQMKVFRDQAEGKYALSHFICIDGVNFMYELRGATQSYYDLVDSPEEAKHILDFATRLCIFVQEEFFKTAGLFEGGTASNVCQWLPGRVVSESVDAFHLASADTFEEWGREVVEKLFNYFDGGVIHLHTNGHHLIQPVSSIKGLKGIIFLDEDFESPCYLKMDEISALRGKIPVVIYIPYEEFVGKLEAGKLPTNILYDVTGVPGIKAANRAMEKVREYNLN